MQILVISDTHKNVENLCRAIEQNPGIDYVFHLGDHDTDLDEAKRRFPEKKYFTVCGNNDFDSVSPFEGIQRLDGRTVYYTHGHKQRVHVSLEGLIKAAKNNGADIAMFGHTHVPMIKYIDGIWVFNPGSASKPLGGSEKSYGIIELSGDMQFIFKTL